MAYDKNSLTRVGSTPYAAGDVKSEYIYATADTKAAVLAANYFNADAARFNLGDRITAVVSMGGTPAIVGVVVTSAKGASPVVVAAGGQQALVDNSGGTTGQALSANLAKQKLTIPVPSLADFANAQVWKTLVPFAFTLLAATFRTGKPATTAAKLATLTATVATVAVTGGVIALTSANQNTTGNNTDASAISGAGATGAAGQTIEFTASGVTAFVEGDGYIEITVLNIDLNNAIASLNAA